MRILHTSDWHLGDRLGWVDRTPEQFRAIDRILGYCEDYAVDVLLVAGDVFEDYHGQTLAAIVRELASRMEPLIRAGMHAVFIPGNHDREHLYQLVESVLAVSPGASARLVFASELRTVYLPDRLGRESTAFTLAPYPTVHRYLTGAAGPQRLSATEERLAIASGFAARLAQARTAIRDGTAAVLVAHAYVRSAETPTLFRMTEADDVPVDPSTLLPWSYAALGHIHKPQGVGASQRARYSGSPIRMDASEAFDEKSACSSTSAQPATFASYLSCPCRAVRSIPSNSKGVTASKTCHSSMRITPRHSSACALVSAPVPTARATRSLGCGPSFPTCAAGSPIRSARTQSADV